MSKQLTMSFGDDGDGFDFAMLDAQFAETVNPRRGVPTYDADSPIVEGSPLGYRAGMTTEVRIAPRWGNVVSDYLRHLRAIDRSPGTIYIRSYQLRTFSQAFRSREPASIERADIERYFASLHHLSRSTKRAQLTAVRGFYEYLVEERIVKENPCRFIKAIRPTIGTPRPADDADIRRALDIAEPRTKMMIMLGAYCGLRRCEIARVHTRDLEPRGGGRFALRVVGKGQTVRRVNLTPFVASLIADHPGGYLFESQKRPGEPLSPGRIGELIHEALPAGVTPHMLRHRYASAFYAATSDLRAVQESLGHTSILMTQTYTAVPQNRMWDGVDAAGRLSA